ncbi:MAG TPA: hypothetical protein VEW28_00675 [Candidatus Kapabacteria bacterium]|nr:hypothetical protein [Candidatus Kapabacteria bacterium]
MVIPIIYAGLAGKGAEETGNLYKRLTNHFRDDTENRIHYFSWFGIRQVNDTTYNTYLEKGEKKELHRLEGILKSGKYTFKKSMLLKHMEALLLEILQPETNKRGPDWTGSERYYQFIPDYTREPSLSEVMELLREISGGTKKIA